MRTKVLITVKAYPAISSKYGETVCTAGITDAGKWVRIYPIPFRKLDYNKRFHKYDWIEIDLERNLSDPRPESFRPKNYDSIETIGHIKSDGNTWAERRKFVLNKVYSNLNELIEEAKNKAICTSLATFKPSKIEDFLITPCERDWDKMKLQKLEADKAQGSLFDTNDINDIQNFEVVDKMPYKFSFKLQDDEGKTATMMIEDWEIGMLYWNSYYKHNNELKACEDVKKKYFYEFAKTKDYYFFLGTTKVHHFFARNPFVIIGDFRPNFIKQASLFNNLS